MRRSVVAMLAALLVLSGSPALAYSDGDSDKVEDDADNCRGSANPFQFDIDGDGEGDVCERPIPMSDSFEGTTGVDLMFGSFRESTLRGGIGSDALYGGPGDDVLDGGPGTDVLVGGPGDDILTGGPGCDVFGIDTAIEHRDLITDFEPGIDRVRFPPTATTVGRNRLPRVEHGGQDLLEVTFLIEGAPDAVVVFAGIPPGTRLVLSTTPCGESSPPASICPLPGAGRMSIFVGFEGMFCPDGGELRANTGVYQSARFGANVKKRLGEKGGSSS
ncbi:MAG: calcium-binding protein [Acidobacteria bacterium]|nr:calcium-binding protein [Acidobacteriota bacterium]